MATLAELVENRLPDEAALFAASLPTFIEEAQAEAGYEGLAEADLSTLQKGLIADKAAKALILPAMSKYKKSLKAAEGDGSGSATFVDKLDFLTKMDIRLDAAIAKKEETLQDATHGGVPLVIVE